MKHHPYANLFPMQSDEEIQSLADDIGKHGLRQPIVIDADEMILDGRNRSAACVIAQVKPIYEPFVGSDAQKLAYVVSVNVHRRHLTTAQRAEIAATIATMKTGENQHTAKKKKEGGSNELPSKPVTTEQAAKLMNVSVASVKRAKAKASPEKPGAAKPAKVKPGQTVKPAEATLTIDSGPVEATDKFNNTPKDKWRLLLIAKRSFLSRRLKHDCRCLTEFCEEAEAVYSELGFKSPEEMIREGYELEPAQVSLAVVWLSPPATVKPVAAKPAKPEAEKKSPSVIQITRTLFKMGKDRARHPQLMQIAREAVHRLTAGDRIAFLAETVVWLGEDEQRRLHGAVREKQDALDAQ